MEEKSETNYSSTIRTCLRFDELPEAEINEKAHGAAAKAVKEYF